MTTELSDSLKKQTYSTEQSSSTNGTGEADKVEIIAGVTQCVNTGCKTVSKKSIVSTKQMYGLKIKS